jgi:serine/threonine protein kinase
LRNEADLLSRVKSQGTHRGIVQLLHTYLRAETPCLEFEYVAGGDLSGLIAQWRQEPPPDRVAECTWLMHELADIMAFAHKLNPPIVHRDLKPANILLQPAGDGTVRVRVADFGIGGIAAQQTIEQATRGVTSGAILATVIRGAYTPLYASPQQMRGEPPNPRDDVYALGVIWYQLLIGDLRSGAPTGLDWADDLRASGMNEDMIRLLGSCVASQPHKRPADAKQLFDLINTPRRLKPSIRIESLHPQRVSLSPGSKPPPLAEHILKTLRDNNIVGVERAVTPAQLKALPVDGYDHLMHGHGAQPQPGHTYARKPAMINSTMNRLVSRGLVRTDIRNGVNHYYLPS